MNVDELAQQALSDGALFALITFVSGIAVVILILIIALRNSSNED